MTVSGSFPSFLFFTVSSFSPSLMPPPPFFSSLSPFLFLLLGWGHHMLGLFVWSCYGNSRGCFAPVRMRRTVFMLVVRWGRSSASCMMTSSRHRPQHIEWFCFLGLCNGQSSTPSLPPTPLCVLPRCLTADESWGHVLVNTDVCLMGTMRDCPLISFHIVFKCGIELMGMQFWLFMKRGRKVHELEVNSPASGLFIKRQGAAFSVFDVVTKPPLLLPYHRRSDTWRSSAAILK